MLLTSVGVTVGNVFLQIGVSRRLYKNSFKQSAPKLPP